ncbi:MAG: hypothetical protein ACPHID_06410 [Thermoplasmatota archaeon]
MRRGFGPWTPLIAVVAALLLVTVANLIALQLGLPMDWLLSLGTAAVVAVFLALMLRKPREGFTIED